MAKRKKKGISTVSLVLVFVMIVGVALAFSGLFIDWTTSKTDVDAVVTEVSSESRWTLQDWADANEAAVKVDGEVEYFVLVNMFAWITAAAVAVAAVLFVLKLVIRLKLLGILGGVAGIIAIVSGILAIVFTVLMGNNYNMNFNLIINASTTTMPAIGCYLLAIGGVLGGGAAIGAAVKS